MPQQLTSEDRAILAQLLSTNMPKSEIARRLKKHRSTTYREPPRSLSLLSDAAIPPRPPPFAIPLLSHSPAERCQVLTRVPPRI